VITGADGDGGVPHGSVLASFVDAVIGGDAAALAAARKVVKIAVGDAAFVDVCATVASFNAVVKIADGTGIPLEDAKEARTRDIREALDINAFQTKPD
jgi:hypothetical protein